MSNVKISSRSQKLINTEFVIFFTALQRALERCMFKDNELSSKYQMLKNKTTELYSGHAYVYQYHTHFSVITTTLKLRALVGEFYLYLDRCQISYFHFVSKY